MATKFEGGGGGALDGPLKKYRFFAASLKYLRPLTDQILTQGESDARESRFLRPTVLFIHLGPRQNYASCTL